jgi:hypothetical protein
MSKRSTDVSLMKFEDYKIMWEHCFLKTTTTGVCEGIIASGPVQLSEEAYWKLVM